MKKIWKYLKQHWQEDFSFKEYAAVALLLVVLLITNYQLDFEDSYLDTNRGLTKFVCYFLFYAVPYYTVLLLITTKRNRQFDLRRFFVHSLFALSILSLDSSVPFLPAIVSWYNVEVYLWGYKVTVNLISLFTVLLPLYLYYRTYEKYPSGFYGLSAKKFDPKPYFVMLLIMLPLLISATFLPSFLKQYPMYKTSEAHLYLGVPEWVTALVYEVAYGLDFVTVELLFRGFFVIGMIHIVGRRAVLAMAVIYCMLHFGKPPGEAISSIFGGYILGVIAYETKSIWGGIIVHLGIAWMMELVSFIAKQL